MYVTITKTICIIYVNVCMAITIKYHAIFSFFEDNLSDYLANILNDYNIGKTINLG